MEIKQSKELKAIVKAIENWVKKHKNDVCFYGGFFAFDKESEVVDDLMLAYGLESVIKIGMKELNEEIKKNKNKDGFVNI